MQVPLTKSLARRVGFGKHKGRTLGEIPRDYLRWLIGQDGCEPVRSGKATTAAPKYKRFKLSHGLERDIRNILKSDPGPSTGEGTPLNADLRGS